MPCQKSIAAMGTVVKSKMSMLLDGLRGANICAKVASIKS